MSDRPSSVGTNGTSSLPIQGFGEDSYLRFIIKFVCTWRFWLKSDITKRRFSRGTIGVYEMSLCFMFVINADCILCEARTETEGDTDDPNIAIEKYQYLTVSEASISNLSLRVSYSENSQRAWWKAWTGPLQILEMSVFSLKTIKNLKCWDNNNTKRQES